MIACLVAQTISSNDNVKLEGFIQTIMGNVSMILLLWTCFVATSRKGGKEAIYYIDWWGGAGGRGRVASDILIFLASKEEDRAIFYVSLNTLLSWQTPSSFQPSVPLMTTKI